MSRWQVGQVRRKKPTAAATALAGLLVLAAGACGPTPPAPPAPPVPTVAAGLAHSLEIRADHTLWAWGDNSRGQLGDGGRSTTRSTPYQVTSGAWLAVAAGNYHSLAVAADHSLWAWGDNARGQIGDATTTRRVTPRKITTSNGWPALPTSWTAVAAGASDSFALATDGTLWAWGDNINGALGNGTTTRQTYPTKVTGGAATWKAVAAGDYFTLGIGMDGSLWTWGDNTDGQLGDGSHTQRNRPVRVAASAAGQPKLPAAWTAIAAGYGHSLAIAADGSLWSWGFNGDGQLGSGSADRAAPGLVNASTWKAVAAGNVHSLAIGTNGTLWTWGYDGSGQLGDGLSGTGVSRHTPFRVGTSTAWTVVAGGFSHSLALAGGAGGKAWRCGANDKGQLGDTTTTQRPSPVTAALP